MKRSLMAILVVLVYSGALFAQDLKFDAQVRYRGESKKNGGVYTAAAFSDAMPMNNYQFLRSRLGLSFDGGNNVSGYIQLQDSRDVGSNSGTLVNGVKMDMHQAYLKVSDLFGKGLEYKAGRMEVALGNQRLVGAVGWHNVGRSFDGVHVSKKGEKVDFQAFNLKVREAAPIMDGEGDPDAYLSGAWFTYNGENARKMHFFGLLDFDNARVGDDDRALFRMTGGFDYLAKAGSFNYEVEGAYQLGSQGGTDISAYMLGARLKYNISGDKKPFIGLGFDMLSGDDGTGDSYNTFNTMYATNHKFYGHMDYFLDIPKHASLLGLNDLMLSGGFNFSERVAFSGDIHHFMYNQENGAGDSSLGNEIDIRVNYKRSADYTFTTGASLFLPGDVKPDDNMGFWFYTQLVYNFKQ